MPVEAPRSAWRLMEDREPRLSALDAAIGQGLADIKADRVHDLDAACDALDAELAVLPDPQA